MAKSELRQRARELRMQGWTLSEIVEEIGAAKSSVSVWTRDIKLTQDQQHRIDEKHRTNSGIQIVANQNKARFRKQRTAYQRKGREKAKEGDLLHAMGCMLQWAEGAKNRNTVQLVNSDPNMMTMFVRFLRESMNVKDEDISVFIHCHNKDHVERIEQYWLELLELPKSALRTAQVIKGSDARHNRLHNGVCSIRVYNTELVQHIYGAIQEYSGFDEPAWLD